ncbi:nucleotide-binding universal stress UspA family protein [Filimonas zeae]|uniref:UspA domain-containing protein n=1 Tax=Filimonas zeae TaxID=1737353 RepID=A0A917IZZ9_9BACT|nr:universal stress protein [Filimonas zeae]MDR6339958.1 nucleotide-binding universal stress UspA family protein [Filimonas zeae]GGH70475.1 hypothetical protein GCM10011379_28780 [Filimonas zeae]
MLTLLILTDFTDAAFHAAKYACSLSRNLPVKRIILFHAYQAMAPVLVTTEPGISSEELDREYTDMLLELANRLEGEAHADTAIDLQVENARMQDVLNELCVKENIDLVVMGIGAKRQQTEGSSNAVSIPEKVSCPVLVVPETAVIQPVKHTVFATDLRELNDASYNELHKWFSMLGGKLDVLNIDQQEKEFGPESYVEIKELHFRLEQFNPEYHYNNGAEEGKSIIRFAHQRGASLIVSLPRHRSFWGDLFHQSISREITYRSDIPLLFVHDL